jgi:beta-carotene 3-hydroxylase
MIIPILVFLVAFIGMEFVAYLAHRYVYHKLLWIFHKSHHTPRSGPFEWNDVFPVFFAMVTILTIWFATRPPVEVDLLAGALGVTLYGMVYTFIHDVYAHRRIPGLVFKNAYLQRLKKAHMVHHATGGEPYGLLFFRLSDAGSKKEEAKPVESDR